MCRVIPARCAAPSPHLSTRAAHWTFVSTVSVYADNRTPGQRADTAPLRPPTAPEIEHSTEDIYGAAKVACEQATGENAFICRAGLIAGPEDPTGRFTYWPVRLARGGEVLVPGTPDDAVQLIDVRDLAQWIVHAAQSRLTGRFDAIGPSFTRGEFLAQCAAAVGSSCTFTWADRAFLESHDIRRSSGWRRRCGRSCRRAASAKGVPGVARRRGTACCLRRECHDASTSQVSASGRGRCGFGYRTRVAPGRRPIRRGRCASWCRSRRAARRIFARG